MTNNQPTDTQPYEVPRWDEDRIVIENGWLDGRCGRCGEPLPVEVLTDQPDPETMT